jgi:hypothetical protein
MNNAAEPTVTLAPARVARDGEFMLNGSGWPNAPVSLRLGRARAQVVHVVKGRAESGGIVPEDGMFEVRISTRGLGPGSYRIRVVPRGPARTRYLRVEVFAATS